MKFTKELFFSLDILPTVLDSINDGVNVVDTDGILVYVNDISANYVNQTRDAMIGRPITDFYPAAVLLSVLKNRQPILDKKIHFVAPKKYVVNSYPIFYQGEFLGAFSVFRDIQEIDQLNSKTLKHSFSYLRRSSSVISSGFFFLGLPISFFGGRPLGLVIANAS